MLVEICKSEFSTMCHSVVNCATQTELVLSSFTSILHSLRAELWPQREAALPFMSCRAPSITALATPLIYDIT